jgi:acyl-[acyl-carrier-protein]-phospholipid O-acyltransferase/long-chain-fatty-acid--[acyl-carrier-protein] ligase
MIWAGAGIAAILGLWLVFAGYLSNRHRVSFRQGMLYAPLKLFLRIVDDELPAIDRQRGTIYVVSHRSRLDPAVTLSLLPSDTLHILDHDTASAWWMGPFRELARTIAFNATHIFVSRRLVRILRGKGRIAVYLPENPEPDVRSFRLFRAVARVAVKAEAAIVPIRIGQPGRAIGDRPVGQRVVSRPRGWLAVTSLAPHTIDELRQRIGAGSTTASSALFDRIAQTRIADTDRASSIFAAVAGAARRFGNGHAIHEGPTGKIMNWRDMMVTARLVARRIADLGDRGDRIGLLLDGSPHLVPAFLATQSAGLVATMLSTSQEPDNIARAIRAGSIRLVLTSRETAISGRLAAAIERAGAKLVRVDDILEQTGALELFLAGLVRNRAVAAATLDDHAVALLDAAADRLLFLTHRNLLANAAQIAARVSFAETEKVISFLPPTDAAGLVAGLLTPLLSGRRLRIATGGEEEAGVSRPEPGLLLSQASRISELLPHIESSLAGGRAIIVMDAPLDTTARETLTARSVGILEAFALNETSGLISLASGIHQRANTFGRLLPAMRARFEAVEGLERGGRLQLSGPNLAAGWMEVDEPARIRQHDGGWFDTGLLATLDQEGFLTVYGDASRVARIGDTDMPLAPCEALATAMWPDSRHAAIAIPNRRRGERIVLVTTEPEIDKAALRRQAKVLGLSERALPAEIVFVEKMPTGQSGHFDLEEVRRVAERQLSGTRAA